MIFFEFRKRKTYRVVVGVVAQVHGIAGYANYDNMST